MRDEGVVMTFNITYIPDLMLSEDGANGMGWNVVLLHIRRPVGEGGLSNMRV